ncbi:hypothetical protein RhiJN_12529 [Ceratobasidium sp. AG-Ba]|nr:hypothetical protein RhiJN_12529 [Ceratobasidium sp. AG-Ba]
MRIFCGVGSKQSEEERQRDEYISSSLEFSKILVNRLSSSRRSNRHDRLVRILFDRQVEWPQEDSEVMEWYKQLQQLNLETKFRSIEHRRHTDNRLFHEFLLLKLLDGGICRVERGGDGSRVDAVRLIGCTPHDLIQRFTKDDYDEFSSLRPSELIGDIHFTREFDIRDVLAICYSVQPTPACTVYTLQRYNCYFLCWTIISVLTRQLESWETMASTQWDAAITSELDRLSNLSTKDAKNVFPLRLLALLDPDSSHPSECLINRLRVDLHSSNGTLQKRNQAFAATLWADNGRLAMRQGLKSTFKSTEINLMSSESLYD